LKLFSTNYNKRGYILCGPINIEKSKIVESSCKLVGRDVINIDMSTVDKLYLSNLSKYRIMKKNPPCIFIPDIELSSHRKRNIVKDLKVLIESSHVPFVITTSKYQKRPLKPLTPFGILGKVCICEEISSYNHEKLDFDKNIFELTQELFKGKKKGIDNIVDSHFSENLLQFMVHENYPNYYSNGSDLSTLSNVADEISFGDTIQRKISSTQDYSLMPYQAISSTVYPITMNGGNDPFKYVRLQFPKQLGKISLTNKNKRIRNRFKTSFYGSDTPKKIVFTGNHEDMIKLLLLKILNELENDIYPYTLLSIFNDNESLKSVFGLWKEYEKKWKKVSRKKKSVIREFLTEIKQSKRKSKKGGKKRRRKKKKKSSVKPKTIKNRKKDNAVLFINKPVSQSILNNFFSNKFKKQEKQKEVVLVRCNVKKRRKIDRGGGEEEEKIQRL